MSSSAKKITLKSSDGESFEVDEAVALESQTIKHMIEDDCADNGIPLPNVTSKILAKVIEYCKKHVDAAKPDEKVTEEELKNWDTDFVKVDQATLFDLILVRSLSYLFRFLILAGLGFQKLGKLNVVRLGIVIQGLPILFEHLFRVRLAELGIIEFDSLISRISLPSFIKR
jgi:hypothetical protein